MAPAKSITIIKSPYHIGIRNVAVANGPDSVLKAGLVETLEAQGFKVHSVELESVDEFEGDICRSFELFRRTSKAVTDVINGDSFPIILAGNCSSSVGVTSGIKGSEKYKHLKETLGCVWFDAHDDFNTPDVLSSGYFDSMPVAMLANQCWKKLLSTVPNFHPMDLESSFINVGLRDVTDVERNRVIEAGFSVVWGSTTEKVNFSGQLASALKKRDLEAVTVHFDVDALDTSIGRANKFAAEGGLLKDDLNGCLMEIAERTKVAALTVASYDPAYDEGGQIPVVTVKAIGEFVKRLKNQGVVE